MKELTIKQHEVLNKAIAIFGKEPQKEMAIEESLELALALQKLKRIRGNESEKLFNVCDEIADMTIMLNQLYKIFNDPELTQLISERIDYKIERLQTRLIEKIV